MHVNDIEPFDFGVRLRQLRENRKMTQKDLAKAIDVCKNTISRYESNYQNPTMDKIQALARLFNVTADYIVGFEHAPTIQVHDLTEEQRKALDDFIEKIIKKG